MTRALQIDLLLAPVIDYRSGDVASGYSVYFYAAGTTTAKNVWTEKEKTNAYTSRTLGSNGTVQVYGDGVYKIVIKDTEAATVYTWDNVKCQANTFTVQSKANTYTATADDDMILVDTTAGDVTINIATVTDFTHPLLIKRTAGANNVIINPYLTQPVDGEPTLTLTANDDSAMLYPDVVGEAWYLANILAGIYPLTAGDMLYASAPTSLAKLAAGTANFKMFMNAAGGAPEWASGVKVGALSPARDLSAASGDVSYTGVGFKPSLIFFFGGVHTTQGTMSAGFSNGTAHEGVFLYLDTTLKTGVNSAAAINIHTSAADAQTAIVKSFDADGFTLTWTKASSPTGTTIINYIALR